MDAKLGTRPRDALGRLLAPASLAFVGGKEAEIALRGTLDLGFAGKIYAVHPTRDNLAGVPTVPTVADLPEVPEAAFIAIKREPSIEVVRQLAALGTAGVVVYASGFSEVGAEGEELQQELLNAAGDMTLIGPNCYGFVNYLDRLSPWPDIFSGGAAKRGVALVTQSGSMAGIWAFIGRRLPLGGIYTLGNQAQIGMAELLSHLADDPRVSAIGLHIEGLQDVPAFAEAAAKARRNRKPVIVLKTGRSELGAKTTRSHTNSLSGSDDLYNALFERYGIARVSTMSAFAETLTLLHHGGPVDGYNLLSMSCSGGEAALVADLTEAMKLTTPPFPDHSKDALAAALNAYVQLENPLDYHTFIWGQRGALTACYAGAMSGGFDAAMLLIDTPDGDDLDKSTWIPAINAIVDAAKQTGARAVVAVHLPEDMPADEEAVLVQNGIPVLRGLRDALDAIEAAADISANWRRADLPPLLREPTVSSRSPRQLTEAEAKERLAAAGLRVPRGQACSIAQAADAAEAIGFPVTLKVSSTSLAHKSDVGGLALNLQNRAQTEEAAERISQLGDELLVEKMIQGTVCELIVGLKRDPQFGLALVLGAGGVLTELLTDCATLILPTTSAEIERALSSLRIARLIDGYRGASGDREALIRAIEAIAAFAADNRDTIEELDVNPLLVLPPGHGVVAVDALLRIRED
ncbi:MAG: acetate--CoA ligase family protein [Alphaproteobacteria bacterium]|nr:acetate--CoA ligase family protein [Alphaproteobacteria bacterium]